MWGSNGIINKTLNLSSIQYPAESIMIKVIHGSHEISTCFKFNEPQHSHTLIDLEIFLQFTYNVNKTDLVYFKIHKNSSISS
jgi:hypothetical protein